MTLRNLFKPAAHIPEIQDQDEVKAQYKYWRLRIFYGMYVGYAFYYFTRKSFTFAMPLLMQDLGFKISDLGILSSIFALTYGVSKFLSGVMADRSNPRLFMSIGLIATGFCNILFGLTSSLLLFAVFWGLNGWFQGWGWPPCARLLTHWYSQKERGRWWGFWNTSHSLGGATIPFVVAFFAVNWGWRFGMYIPGITCIIMGFFLLNRLRDTPQSLGLPPIEKFQNDYPTNHTTNESEISVKEILFTHVLNNKFIWILAISYFFVYVIRQAVNDFGAYFLMNTKGYSMLAANASIFWFEMGGICGSLAAGWASDLIFKGRRTPINVLFSLGVIGALIGLYLTPAGLLFVDYALMFSVGFFIFGPQLLIGISAAELSHKKAAATATGFAGWWAYLGAATAGYPITKIQEIFGWEGFFTALALCGLIPAMLLLPLWKIKTNPKYAAKPETVTAAASDPVVEELVSEG